MGICYDCLIYLQTTNGRRAVRSCMVLCESGMRLTTWGPESEETEGDA